MTSNNPISQEKVTGRHIFLAWKLFEYTAANQYPSENPVAIIVDGGIIRIKQERYTVNFLNGIEKLIRSEVYE